jgi:1-acyl-sn-glycerol-3-phosphate acyltransferase
VRRSYYMIARLLAKLILLCVAKNRILGAEHARLPGPWVLAANHISHFDPVTISALTSRDVDWMAMVELFQNRTAAFWIHALNAFPTDRARADRSAVRTALDRLRQGRVVGMFPEGGIRNGAQSAIEGAPFKPGATIIAEMAGVPVVPCVLLGTDRLYCASNWLPLRRIRIWAVFGPPIHPRRGISRHETREKMVDELAASFRELCSTARREFALNDDDLPQPAERRRAMPS